jgi:hypothetical protein
MGKTVLETFTIFPFSIVLALSLGEAFKQTVSEKLDGAIQWDRIPALLTFLLLVLPFYQGMNRYLLLTYGGASASTQQYSAVALVLDGAAFMFESALFFAMSRNLANARWRYFYLIVLALLVVDTLWGFSALLRPHSETTSSIQGWMWLNFAFALVLVVLNWKGEKYADRSVAIFGVAAMFVRTTIDYILSWNLYFGSP